MATTITSRSLRLEPVAGPAAEPFTVGTDKPHVVGRQSTCEVVLADTAVSRRHAQFVWKGGSWLLSDLESRHGTYLNGIRLAPGDASPVFDGDQVRIGPFTFRVGGPTGTARLLTTHDDAASTINRVHRIPAHELSLRAQHRLDLLIDCAASITAATSEQQLAEAVLDALVAGTGFNRAFFIRQHGIAGGGSIGQIEVIAARDPLAGVKPGIQQLTRSRDPAVTPARMGELPTFSRSLIQAAMEGQLARLDGQDMAPQDYGQSIVQLGIQAAICAPVMLDAMPAAYLYLDARRPDPGGGRPAHPQSQVQPDAAGFCQAVARICGLALSNLKRLELATRQRRLEGDLEAARAAQVNIMPPTTGAFDHAGYVFRSRPGRYVAGDLFDIFQTRDGKVAMFLGDVEGKGMGAGVLMATAQAHLNALLRRDSDPAAAVNELNRHITARAGETRFISLWVGVIDPVTRRLSFVDAGHGYWLIKHPGHPPCRVDSPGGLLVGVDPDSQYLAEELPIEASSRVIVYSDGLVEQASPQGEQFGTQRVIEAMASSGSPATDVDALINALLNFASTAPAPAASGSTPQPPRAEQVALSDDVTVASVEFKE